MRKRLSLLLSSGALLLAAGPALADAPMGFAGTVSGEYSHLDVSGGDADSWGINGEGAFGFGASGNFGAQINGGYHNLSGDGGGDADIFDIGGSAFWASQMARAGATVAYKSIDLGGGFDVNATAYGLFGEYYLGDFFTVGAHGGGWTGEFAGFDDDGFYIGGRATGYIMPNLAISGTVDHMSEDAGDATTWGIDAEWQFSETTPVSIYGGYRNTSFEGAGDIDMFFIGVKFYAGGAPMPLVGNHRNGTLGWLGDPLRGLQF